jgi:hypothetical protein
MTNDQTACCHFRLFPVGFVGLLYHHIHVSLSCFQVTAEPLTDFLEFWYEHHVIRSLPLAQFILEPRKFLSSKILLYHHIHVSLSCSQVTAEPLTDFLEFWYEHHVIRSLPLAPFILEPRKFLSSTILEICAVLSRSCLEHKPIWRLRNIYKFT